MGRYTGPKSKRSRRVATRLFPKDEKILTKRNFPPGMHGSNSRRLSEYGVQLIEKQKAKWMYGIMERQFKKYYLRAAKKTGQTDILLLQFLETRLDNVVYRLGFAKTRPQARQLVSHKFMEVNGKMVDIPSYEVKIGDTIKVRDHKATKKYIATLKTLISSYKAPEWLQLDAKALTGKLLSLPTPEQAELVINTHLIIEHYSR